MAEMMGYHARVCLLGSHWYSSPFMGSNQYKNLFWEHE